MAFDSKYGQIITSSGQIPDDEPVFLFRAQDQLLPKVLMVYAEMCENAGSPPEHVSRIRQQELAVRTWQAKHHTQVPNSGMDSAS